MAKTKKKRTDFPHISIKCEICGKSKRGQLFYRKRGNNQNLDDPDTFVPICRDCFLKDFVPEDPKTFLWMMKEQDRPFIQSEWVNTVNSIRAQYPDGSKDDTIYGTYMRNIGTSPDYKHFGFDDSGTVEEIVAERKREKAEQERIEREKREKRAEKVMATFGNVTLEGINSTIDTSKTEEAEEATPEEEVEEDVLEEESPPEEPRKEEEAPTPQPEPEPAAKPEPQPKPEPEPEPEPQPEPLMIDEQKILADLTDDDRQYLMMKWGESFRPSEWLKMEDMYQKYTSEFEMNIDREETLKSMCKTNINMQRCLDSGDATSASKFSSMFDQLRKSGSFTEAQRKEEEKNAYVDSIGELVAAVEREGGIIEKFDYGVEAPPDKVDFTLKDMQEYTYNLVKNEMGLGDLIETYIKRLDEDIAAQKANLETVTVDMGYRHKAEGVPLPPEEEDAENDKIADAWLSNLEDEIAASVEGVGEEV